MLLHIYTHSSSFESYKHLPILKKAPRKARNKSPNKMLYTNVLGTGITPL